MSQTYSKYAEDNPRLYVRDVVLRLGLASGQSPAALVDARGWQMTAYRRPMANGGGYWRWLCAGCGKQVMYLYDVGTVAGWRCRECQGLRRDRPLPDSKRAAIAKLRRARWQEQAERWRNIRQASIVAYRARIRAAAAAGAGNRNPETAGG